MCALQRQSGEAGSSSTSVLLVLITELITQSAVLQGCQDGSFRFVLFFFSLLPLLIDLNSEVHNNSVISGYLVRQRSKQAHLKISAF